VLAEESNCRGTRRARPCARTGHRSSRRLRHRPARPPAPTRRPTRRARSSRARTWSSSRPCARTTRRNRPRRRRRDDESPVHVGVPARLVAQQPAHLLDRVRRTGVLATRKHRLARDVDGAFGHDAKWLPRGVVVRGGNLTRELRRYAAVCRVRSTAAGDSTCSIAVIAAPVIPARSPRRLGTMRRSRVASGSERLKIPSRTPASSCA
jgi:hypothetical protein